MKFKIDEIHDIIVTENKEYNCYEVYVIEYTYNRILRRFDGRYSRERLEEIYGIAL